MENNKSVAAAHYIPASPVSGSNPGWNSLTGPIGTSLFILVSNGNIEMYRVTDGGLEMFIGYAHDLIAMDSWS